MQRITVLIVALCAAVFGPVVSGELSGTVPVPRLPMNLDLAPEDRWSSVLNHWDVNDLRNMFESLLTEFVPKEGLALMEFIGEGVDDLLPAPYAGEIKGVAKTLNLGRGQITCLNMLYDFSAACTSIVAQDANGTIWHGRNLDYPKISATLRNITAVIDYQSNGETLYTTTSFVGQVGVFTGMKPNKFTISLNERDRGSIPENLLEMMQALILKKVEFTSFIIRDALAYDNSFEDVLKRVVNEKQVSPVYVILGGVNPGEGAVVTRERTYTLDVWRLDLTSVVNRWFLLETNYDHWTPPPQHDDRRDPGNKAMRAVGQKAIDNNTMWKVLSTQPVLNDITVYTAMMCAAKPDIFTSKVTCLGRKTDLPKVSLTIHAMRGQ